MSHKMDQIQLREGKNITSALVHLTLFQTKFITP